MSLHGKNQMSEEEEERAGHKNPRRPDKVTHAHVKDSPIGRVLTWYLRWPYKHLTGRLCPVKDDTMDSMRCAWENHAQ